MLSNHNFYIGDVFGSNFYTSDVIGIALYFCDVCGLPKQMSEIFEALIVSNVNKAAISVIMMLSNCNYSFYYKRLKCVVVVIGVCVCTVNSTYVAISV